jgi:hypothetical protein
MPKALIAAFVLVLSSFVLGATLFREQVAHAAQGITATIVSPLDGAGNVAVHEQGTANVRILDGGVLTVAPRGARQTVQVFPVAAPGGKYSFIFPGGPIDASLISLTSMRGTGNVLLDSESGVTPLLFDTDGGNVVLPLTQPLTVDRILLSCSQGSAVSCAVQLNVVGR